MPDEIQPDEGQGQTTDNSGGGIFDSYLASVPEEHREAVLPYLKDAEKTVNERLQEASQLRSQYEPFTAVEGIGNYDAESLSQLIALHGQISTDEGLKEWITDVAKDLGLTFAEAEQLKEDVATGAITPEAITQAVQAAVTPLQQRLDAKDEAEQRQQIIGQIEADFTRIQEADSRTYSEEEKSAILDLAATDGYVGQPDWIDKACERFAWIRGLGANGLLSDATQQPAAGLTAGGAAAVEPTTDFATAAEQAKERLRQARGA